MVYYAHIPFQSCNILPKQQDKKEYLLSDSIYTKVKILKSYVTWSKNLLVIKERKDYNRGGSALSLWGIWNVLFFFFVIGGRYQPFVRLYTYISWLFSECMLHFTHTHVGK